MAVLSARLRRAQALWWLTLAVMAPGRTAAQQSAAEYQVKAAYLLNFLRYVEWPADRFGGPGDAIRVCVLGSDPFGTALTATLDGRTAHGRPIRLSRVDAPSEARRCHLVFIAWDEWRRRPDVLAAVHARGVLTVGEGREFTEAGGILAFVPVGRTLRFDVNLVAQERAGLRISSRMLELAAHLHRAPQRGGP